MNTFGKFLSLAAVGLMPAVAFSVPAALAVGATATIGDLVYTSDPARFTFPVTLSGLTDGTEFNMVVTATDGDLDLPTTSGLTSLTGYPALSGNEPEFGAVGTLDDLTAALSEVGFTPDDASAPGTVTVVLSESAGDNYFYYPENAHYYEAISLEMGGDAIAYDADDDGEYSWSEARNAAASRTLFGLTGYLVTVTTADENTFVANKTDASEIWIGAGRRDVTTFDSSLDNPGLVFEWKTGPEAGTAFSKQTSATTGGYTPIDGAFNAWEEILDTEPNNYQYEDEGWMENYVTTNWNGTRGRWNDLPDVSLGGGVVQAFLVEYGGTGTFTAESAEGTRDFGSAGGESSPTGGRELADTGTPAELIAAGTWWGVGGVILGSILVVRSRAVQAPVTRS